MKRAGFILFVLYSSIALADRAAPPPASWWLARGSEKSAYAMRFTATGVIFVDTQRRAHLRPLSVDKAEPGRWTLRLAGIACVLEQPAAGSATLRCVDGARREDFELTAASDEEARALSTIALPPANVCARAEACCPAAYAALKATCDLDYELGKPRDPDKCDGFLNGVRKILEMKKLTPPPACR
jgi:hypothetical protein